MLNAPKLHSYFEASERYVNYSIADYLAFHRTYISRYQYTHGRPIFQWFVPCYNLSGLIWEVICESSSG